MWCDIAFTFPVSLFKPDARVSCRPSPHILFKWGKWHINYIFWFRLCCPTFSLPHIHTQHNALPIQVAYRHVSCLPHHPCCSTPCWLSPCPGASSVTSYTIPQSTRRPSRRSVMNFPCLVFTRKGIIWGSLVHRRTAPNPFGGANTFGRIFWEKAREGATASGWV